MRASWIIASLLLTALMGGAAMAQEEARPNFLFIFSDDHAPHAIGAYGTRYAAVDPTPNIDRLAAQGMTFKASFCTNSICGPSRAVILTGKHSHHNGFMANGNRFDGDQQTFPKLLRAAADPVCAAALSRARRTRPWRAVPRGPRHTGVLVHVLQASSRWPPSAGGARCAAWRASWLALCW